MLSIHRPGPWRLGAAVFFLALSACAQMPQPVEPPAVVTRPNLARGATYGSSTFVLDNGLQVTVVPIAKAPVVHMQVTYRVGSNDEVAGKTGLAHYLEHLMFRAGDKANAGHLEQVAQAGGTSNAYTTNYVTSYYNAVPPEKFEEILKKEAARIGVLTNDTAAAAIELDVVKRERTQRGDSTAAKAYEKAMAALWRDNPNGRPVIGLPVDLDSLTLDDAKAFHAKWYGVSSVGLVISGKTTVDEAYDLVTRYFASLPKSAVPDRPWMRANMPQSKLDRMEVFGPDIGTPSLTRMRVVALADATKPAVLAQVMIAAQALSGSADSRLQRPLVYGEPVALNVNLGAATEFNNSMVVSLSASPLDRKNLDGLDRRLDAELAAIRAKPLTDAEVEKVKRRYIAAFSQSTDRPGAAAAAFSNAFAEGQSPADVEAWPETVKAVSTAQVNAMVQSLIAPGAWLYMRLLPKAVMPPPSHPKGPKVAKAKGGDK